MNKGESLTVAPGEWLATIKTHKDQGFDYLDFISVRELESGEFVVTVHLLDPIGERRIMIEGAWSAQASDGIPSLSEIFAGARWHELEASELFDIGFVTAGGATIAPLGEEPFIAAEPALCRDFALTPRLDQEWPGTNEPGLAPDHPRRKRKRAVPGNPATWGSANE